MTNLKTIESMARERVTSMEESVGVLFQHNGKIRAAINKALKANKFRIEEKNSTVPRLGMRGEDKVTFEYWVPLDVSKCPPPFSDAEWLLTMHGECDLHLRELLFDSIEVVFDEDGSGVHLPQRLNNAIDNPFGRLEIELKEDMSYKKSKHI